MEYDLVGNKVYDGDEVIVLCREGYNGIHSCLRIGVVMDDRIILKLDEADSRRKIPKTKILRTASFIKIIRENK